MTIRILVLLFLGILVVSVQAQQSIPTWTPNLPNGQYVVSLSAITALVMDTYKQETPKSTDEITEFIVQTVGGKSARFYCKVVTQKDDVKDEDKGKDDNQGVITQVVTKVADVAAPVTTLVPGTGEIEQKLKEKAKQLDKKTDAKEEKKEITYTSPKDPNQTEFDMGSPGAVQALFQQAQQAWQAKTF